VLLISSSIILFILFLISSTTPFVTFSTNSSIIFSAEIIKFSQLRDS
jgi:hypothetical protein